MHDPLITALKRLGLLFSRFIAQVALLLRLSAGKLLQISIFTLDNIKRCARV